MHVLGGRRPTAGSDSVDADTVVLKADGVKVDRPEGVGDVGVDTSEGVDPVADVVADAAAEGADESCITAVDGAGGLRTVKRTADMAITARCNATLRES